jgi:hypothetical protein
MDTEPSMTIICVAGVAVVSTPGVVDPVSTEGVSDGVEVALGVSVGTVLGTGVWVGATATKAERTEADNPGMKGLFTASDGMVMIKERRTTITARRIFMKDPFQRFDGHPILFSG